MSVGLIRFKHRVTKRAVGALVLLSSRHAHVSAQIMSRLPVLETEGDCPRILELQGYGVNFSEDSDPRKSWECSILEKYNE